MNFFTQLHAAIRAGRFSKKSGGTSEHADTEARAQAKESERVGKIEALLESVNSASQHVRNFYITFLLAGFYIAVIIWSTTDVMLLKDTPVNLPILNVELPITGFYTFAPFFFLLLHFNLLLQLCLLADKVHRFDGAVIELADHNLRRYYYTRLFAFAFTHTLSGRQHSGFLRFLLILLVWITIVWLPLVVLVGLQVGFLAYHDETILLWQRIAISLDVLILAVFWPIIRSVDGKWRSWFKQATGISWFLHRVQQWRNKINEKWLIWLKQSTVLLWFLHRIQRLHNKTSDSKTAAAQHKPSNQSVILNSGKPMLEGGLSLITAFSVLLFSWFIAVLPDSKIEQFIGNLLPNSWLTDEPLSEKNPDGKRYFRLTEYFFDQRYDVDDQNKKITKSGVFNRNLVLKEQLLVANELSAEGEWHIRHGNENERETALKKVRGLILGGRDFRYANFSEAILPKVDFVGADDKTADLKYTDFQNALLDGVRVKGIELKGANLKFSRLQGANLSGAGLQGASLSDAELQGASLLFARLEGASLSGVELQGASLNGAELQGADLLLARLRGADLSRASLQGADLLLASLQGADLSRANLQGTDLSRANLQDADLSRASLQGADLLLVHLQGADLSRASLQGADLLLANLRGASLNGAELQGANLTGINLTLADMTNVTLGVFTEESLEDWMGSLTREVKDEKLLNRIHTRLSERINHFPRLDEAYGEKIWTENKYGDPVHTQLFGFGNQLSSSVTPSEYYSSLIMYWIELACNDAWMAAGIIQYRLSSLSNFKTLAPPTTAQCLLSLKDQRNQSGVLVCPALSEINDETQNILKRIALPIQPYDTIQASFECKTALSDPQMEAEAPRIFGEAYR